MSDPSLIAAEPRSSAFVRANAGAGKTHILVTRLVRLMLDGSAPEKLLCLTYTRVAAAEMKNRLFQLLSEWAVLSDEDLTAAITTRLGFVPDVALLPKARILFARALETPGGLKVQTIHAFCESLLKRFPLEAGVPPQFELLDTRETQNLQTRLALRILHAPPTPELEAALALITRVLNQDDILLLVREVITHRQKFTPEALNEVAKNMGIKESIPASISAPETFLLDFAATHKSDIDNLYKVLQNAEGKRDKERGDQLDQWRTINNDNIEAAWSALMGFFLDSKGNPRKTILTKAYNDYADMLKTLQESFIKTHKDYLAAQGFQLTAAVYDFAQYFLQAYVREKIRHSRLDYDDLITHTHNLLRGREAAAWVLYKIDQGLAHILVDEAQDTSPAQWQVIAALVEEFFAGFGAQNLSRTIFAVGDEKQSIFSFQGADPAAFAAQFDQFKIQIEAATKTLHDVPLLKSWRSAPAILSFVDEVFKEHEAALKQNPEPLHHIPLENAQAGLVELWPAALTSSPAKEDDKEDAALPIWQQATQAKIDDTIISGRVQVAEKIAAKIATLIEEGYGAQDMLILVRKRDGFVDDMIRALKHRAIAVSGADRMVLTDQIVIMDLMALAEFATTPDDDLNLACFLRSPFGGIDEDTLFTLAHYRGEGESLWQSLMRHAKAGDAPAALKSAETRCRWALAEIDYKAPFDFFTGFLGQQFSVGISTYNEAVKRLGQEIDDPIGEFLRECLAFETNASPLMPPTMQSFLYALKQGVQDIKRDMETGGEAVRIMTIHGAKGLEAPIIFLPDCCASATAMSGRGAPLLTVKGHPPLWRMAQAAQDDYGNLVREAEKQAAAQESQRLLYVALTRARDRLYITGYLGKGRKNIPDDSWYQQIAKCLALPEYAIEYASEYKSETIYRRADTASPAPPPKAERVADSYTMPDWAYQPFPQDLNNKEVWQAPSSLGANTETENVIQKDFSLSGDEKDTDNGFNILLRGNLSHKLLEILPAYKADMWAAKAQDYLANMGSAFSADEQKEIINEVIGVLEEPDFQFMFAPNHKTHNRAEVSICGQITKQDGTPLYLRGQIDLLHENDKEIILIDYKTGALDKDNPLLEQYYRQMACYRALVLLTQKETKPVKPVRCGLLSIRHKQLKFIDEALLDKAFAALCGT